MAIVKMNKFTLLTFKSHKQELLKKLQVFQNVEFVNLQSEHLLEGNPELAELDKDTVNAKTAEYEDCLSKAGYAIEFLKRFAPTKKEANKFKKREFTLEELEERVTSGDWDKHYEEIQNYQKVKDFDEKLKAIENEKIQLTQDITVLQKWTGFDGAFAELRKLKNTTYLLGTVNVDRWDEFESEISAVTDVHMEIINKSKQDMYVFILVGQEEGKLVNEIARAYDFSPVTTTHDESPAEIIENCQKKIIALDDEAIAIGERIQSLDGLIESFELAYEHYYDLVERERASDNFLKTSETILMMGWVPVEQNWTVEELVRDAVGNEYHLTFEEVTDEEISSVPIKLQNPNIISKFESITKMFSLPRYDELDPTPLLAPFYLIFFGMMVADLGYGALMFVGTLLAQSFMNLDEGKKSFLQFFFWLSIPTMFFGWLYGSVFGDIIPMTPIIDPQNDINTLLILSIGFGLVHIFFGLGIKAYMLIRIGKPLDALFDVGSWVLTVVGAIMFVADFMGDISDAVGNTGRFIMFLGMIMVVATQGRQAKSIGGKIGGGLYGLFGLTNYLGDIVSYTRLMALGLAGGSIAMAFNLIMRMFPGAALFIIGPIFFVVAHAFNIFLALLGAYVHSSRLQYVEYFNKFYEGGGRAFAPFKALEKYVQLRED